MEFCIGVIALTITSTPCYLIQYLQPFQNGGRLNFWNGCNFWSDWWIWMKFFVWRWWYWILYTVSLCRESRRIISSQNFLYITLKPLTIVSCIYKVASVVWWLACLPLDPRFSSSNPAEGHKMLSASSFGGEVKPCKGIYLRFCAASWHSAL
jgi:hypothetical protein